MQGKDILRLKRTGNQIISVNDISPTTDILLDFSRKIFINHYRKKYEKMDFSLYQTGPYKHPQHPNIIVTPHFVRDDGVIIYLQLVQNDTYLKIIDDEIAQISMEILRVKNASIFTITLNTNFNIDSIKNIEELNVHKCYKNICEKNLNYSSIISKKYITSFTNKKRKLMDSSSDNSNEQVQFGASFIGTRMATPFQICDCRFERGTKTSSEKNIEPEIQTFYRKDWVSASKTRNYALKDTLVDWLDYWHEKSPEKNKFRESCKFSQTNEYNFPKFIMGKGTQFEQHVIKLIKKKFKSTEFVIICNDMRNYDQRILEYEKNTINEIMKGTPIIYQAVLMNRSGPLSYTYGQPDLLVRSDYLCKIMQLDPLDKNMKTYRAPNLNGNYHYVVVDVKFTTLELCSDGKRIRNSGSVPAYKCQLYIYNHALGKIQGFEPAESYILGRKYKYESNKQYYSENSCFARFGHIEYKKWDKEYINEAISAVNWIKTLRSMGKEWKLLPKPSVTELYPNMSSTSETQWDDFKFDYANKIGEITLLWNCGVKNRQIAHENGVYTFLDPKCTSETVGVNGPKQGPILDKIIHINKKRKFDSTMDRIFMKLNKELDNKWTESSKLRISVDFETINCIFDNFGDLPFAQDQNYLFMIGIAYKSLSNPIEYKMFLVSELSKDAEFQMIYQFYKFLRELTDKYLGKKITIPSLYHWGHIERSFFANLCSRLTKSIGSDIMEDIELMKTELDWYDLSESFKGNPIVINGCFKFGLKEVAGRLSELGLIESNWRNNNSTCSNGSTAMVMAQKAYITSKQTGICITQSSVMKEIMQYNKIDCIVIHEIVDLLKKKAVLDGLIKLDNPSDDDSTDGEGAVNGENAVNGEDAVNGEGAVNNHQLNPKKRKIN
jgi:hypothetical protein